MSSGTETPGPTWDELLVLVERLDRAPYQDVAIDMPGLSIRMSRTAFVPAPVASVAPVNAAPVASLAPAPTASAAPEPSAGEDGTVEITASILGVVYGRPAPDQDPFVAVGDIVEPSSTVAIVEVMKMMNPVEAGVGGRVTTILFADGDTVEFGQALFRVTPADPS